jgi:hypothetical protein
MCRLKGKLLGIIPGHGDMETPTILLQAVGARVSDRISYNLTLVFLWDIRKEGKPVVTYPFVDCGASLITSTKFVADDEILAMTSRQLVYSSYVKELIVVVGKVGTVTFGLSCSFLYFFLHSAILRVLFLASTTSNAEGRLSCRN